MALVFGFNAQPKIKIVNGLYGTGAVDGVKGNHLFQVVLFGKINAESTYLVVRTT